MLTQKAGCYLINKKNKTVAIVYREYLNDYSFPKGHLEEGETLKECAIRETAEETKHDGKIIDEIPATVEQYITPSGKHCECHMFVAEDIGKSENQSTDTHPTHWVKFDDVENKLSYESLKIKWREAFSHIKNYFNF